MVNDSGKRPFHEVHYFITDAEARQFLEQLAEEGSELRARLETTENPREVLLDYNIDIEGIRQPIELPPAGKIKDFIDQFLRGEDRTHNVGYAILYFMLGAMPLVVEDPDGTA